MCKAWGYYHAAATRNGNEMVTTEYTIKKQNEIDDQIQRLTRRARQQDNAS